MKSLFTTIERNIFVPLSIRGLGLASALKSSSGRIVSRNYRIIVQFPYVLFQVKVPAEAFATRAAGEWFLVVVGMHVESKIVDLMEGLVADGTLELLLSAVRQFVVFVVSYQRKLWNNVNMTYIKATKL